MIKPERIRIEKLVINTFIFGTAFPRTANDTLMRKFKAMKGAAISVPTTKTLATSATYSSIGFACKKKLPIGNISKLMMKARITS